MTHLNSLTINIQHSRILVTEFLADVAAALLEKSIDG